MKTVQSPIPFTQLKVLGKPYARSFGPSRNIIIYNTHLQKLLKTLRGFFFLRSRLDETTVGRLIPAIDNIYFIIYIQEVQGRALRGLHFFPGFAHLRIQESIMNPEIHREFPEMF